jgi:hypothetical protein
MTSFGVRVFYTQAGIPPPPFSRKKVFPIMEIKI